MRTLQIGMTADPERGGGLDRYFFSLLRALPSTGTQSAGLVIGDPATLADPVAGVASFAALDAGFADRAMGLRRSVPPLLADVDVVVSHFAPYALPILDSLAKKPFVVHFHGPWSGESKLEGDSRLKVAVKGTLESFVYARGRRFIVLSQNFADILVNQFGIDRSKIRIVPGGVDIARFGVTQSKAEARAHLGWPADRRIVLSVRRLVHAKGLENLIAAAELVRERCAEALFVIAGTGPLAAELRDRIAARNLQEHIRLVGHVSEADLPIAYRAADLFVVPTIALEGFGLVVVEALACGTPALVTPVGGLPEVVRDLSNDLILDGYEPRQLADGIVAALTGGRDLPSEAVCRTYAERFDWDVIAGRVASVYAEALES